MSHPITVPVAALASLLLIGVAARAQDREPGRKASAPARPTGDIRVYNEVEGRTTIISLLPEGMSVKKGQVVCELDSADFRDALVEQAIATRKAEAAYQKPKSSREAAEAALKEYVKGLAPQQLDKARAAVADAEKALDKVRRQVEGPKSKGASKKGDGPATKDPALLRAELAVERAETRLNVLETYTITKRTKVLQSEVEKARTDELAKLAILQLERQKEEKLRRQIEKSQIEAPADGQVVYPRPADPGRGTEIQEGAIVRERQLIFLIRPEKATGDGK
jgi:multidrug efflux pump subunit AcrA (membrane-fusion protein)